MHNPKGLAILKLFNYKVGSKYHQEEDRHIQLGIVHVRVLDSGLAQEVQRIPTQTLMKQKRIEHL